MTETDCDRLRLHGAELALGILDGLERAAFVKHLQRCSSCRREVAELGAVADKLVDLVPAAEPPAGFEERALARLGSAPSGRAPRIALRTWLFAVAAAATFLAGVSGWAIGHNAGADKSDNTVSAALMSQGRRVGEVVAYSGARPSVGVVVYTGAGAEPVTCELQARSGGAVPLGTFWLPAGGGYWDATVNGAGKEVIGAKVFDSSGRLIGRARFSKIIDL